MLSLLIIIILLIIVICYSYKKKHAKEKFRNDQIQYPEVQKYYKKSYDYGMYNKKHNYLHFGKFADFIPLINHIIL